MRRLPIALLALLLALAAAPASAEVAQQGGVRVSLEGGISPERLPRSGAAPVRVSFATRIAATRAGALPQLRSIEIAINRAGKLDFAGLPSCAIEQIQPATSAKALAACRGALIGRGRFSASVDFDEQAAFPAEGEMLAFNGTDNGRPAILAHIYGTDPVPTSLTLPFAIAKAAGTFGTVLTAKLPLSGGSYVTGFELSLHRLYSHRGKRHSYANAGCPAPKGFPGAAFPFARATYGFSGGRALEMTLTRSCRARG
jgi:hypothetical protein